MDCHTCKHSRPVPGDAHLECTCLDSPTKRFIALLAPTTFMHGQIEFDPVGLNNGWCNWPLNFDPIWIKSCVYYDDLRN